MSDALPIRISSPEAEGTLQVSKWLETQVLLEASELELLLQEIAPVHLFNASGVHAQRAGEVSTEELCSAYADYLTELKNGSVPDISQYRTLFSCVLTRDQDALYAMSVGEDRQLIKPCRPVIQMQPASIGFSREDKKFRPKVFGEGSISWGLQFAYPQLFQNPKTQEIEKIDESEKFPNTALFRSLQRWLRKHSQPTPFLIDGEKINSPIRIGKECLCWASSHPQLQSLGIEI